MSSISTAQSWLESFFADLGMRWWPYMRRQLSYVAPQFPATITVMIGASGRKPTDAETVGAGQSHPDDAYWALHARSLVSIVTRCGKDTTEIPSLEAPLLAPAQWSADPGVVADLVALGQSVMGPLYRTVQRSRRGTEDKLLVIADHDSAWIDSLGSIYYQAVLAGAAKVDAKSSVDEVRNQANRVLAHSLETIGKLVGDKPHGNFGRKVPDDPSAPFISTGTAAGFSEVISALDSMVDNRFEKALKAVLEDRFGVNGVALEGQVPAKDINADIRRMIMRQFGLESRREEFDALLNGPHGEKLLDACRDDKRLAEACREAGVEVDHPLRMVLMRTSRFRSRRSAAFASWKLEMSRGLSLDENGSQEAASGIDSTPVQHGKVPQAGDSDRLGVGLDDEVAEIFDLLESMEAADHEDNIGFDPDGQKMRESFERLEPKHQVLWDLARSRVAFVAKASGEETIERGVVYVRSSDTIVAALKEDLDGESLRRFVKQFCEVLQHTHPALAPEGERGSLLCRRLENLVGVVAAVAAAGTSDDHGLPQFKLEPDKRGHLVLRGSDRAMLESWKMSLRRALLLDREAQWLLLPQVAGVL